MVPSTPPQPAQVDISRPGKEATLTPELPLPEDTSGDLTPGLDKGAEGGGEIRRYPVRERRQNVKLKDFEVYGAVGGRKKKIDRLEVNVG